MSLGVSVGKKNFEIGAFSFLKAWFSTVFVNLESGSWGSKFPVIMREFYQGRLCHSRAQMALEELDSIRSGLAEFSADKIVWDFEDRAARPPWGDAISSNISSLADYFVTSDGKPLLDVLEAAFTEAAEGGRDAAIT